MQPGKQKLETPYSTGLYCNTLFTIFDSTATCRIKSWQDVNYDIQVDTVFMLHPQKPGEKFTILTIHCTARETCQQFFCFYVESSTPIQRTAPPHDSCTRKKRQSGPPHQPPLPRSRYTSSSSPVAAHQVPTSSRSPPQQCQDSGTDKHIHHLPWITWNTYYDILACWRRTRTKSGKYGPRALWSEFYMSLGSLYVPRDI